MKLDRETKRIVTQFLNALAVALLATLVLAPIASGNLNPASTVMAVGCAAVLHAAALLIARRS